MSPNCVDKMGGSTLVGYYLNYTIKEKRVAFATQISIVINSTPFCKNTIQHPYCFLLHGRGNMGINISCGCYALMP